MSRANNMTNIFKDTQYITILDFSQIIQLGAQFCLNIFIYVSSLHVSGIQLPIIRQKSLYLCNTGICHSGWVA